MGSPSVTHTQAGETPRPDFPLPTFKKSFMPKCKRSLLTLYFAILTYDRVTSMQPSPLLR
jgi:hypothetical protein